MAKAKRLRTKDEAERAAEKRAEQIIHILAEVAGGRSVHTILLNDDDMPGSSTFWRWHMDDENLRDNLARARENGIEALMEKAQHIAETPQMGEIVMVERDPDHQKDIDEGAEVTSIDGSPYEGMIVKVRKEDMLGHRKLQIDTLYKRAQMIAPRKYGPKLDLTSDGKALGLAKELDEARRRAAGEK